MRRMILTLAALTMIADLAAAVELKPSPEPKPTAIVNPAIDMQGHLNVAQQAAKHRESRRISEEEFIRMSQGPKTVILDCRSKQKYDLLHVKGAIHLDFSDITVDSLKKVLPDKNTRILIYCNNNFLNSEAFLTKSATASLNLSTYITLYDYGYRNVYELGPLLDEKKCKLPLVGRIK